MKAKSDTLYLADEGKILVRNSDGFVMGSGLDLGIDDSIENYHEEDDPNYSPDSDSDSDASPEPRRRA